MKNKIFIFIILICVSQIVSAQQGFRNNGANVQILNGASVVVSGTNGDVINQTGSTFSVAANSNLFVGGVLNNVATFSNVGKVFTSKTLNAPSALNVGGLGLEITTASTLNNLTLSWFGAAQTGELDGGNSIVRYYRLELADYTVSNATIVFHYEESELNGLTESELTLWTSSDGDTWTQAGGTLSTSNNSVTLTGLSSLKAFYTLAESLTTATTWTGSSWDNGTPDATKDAIINGNYSEATGFICKDLTVNSGFTLNVPSLQTVTVEGNLVNNGTIWLKSASESTAATGALLTKGTITNNGAMKAEKFLTIPKGVGNGNWHFLASPMVENIAVGNILLGDYVYRYLQTPAWESLVFGQDNIASKVGYLVQTVKTGGKNVTFNGTFNTGNFTVPLATAGDKWNLVGNPYPSPLDLNQVSLASASNNFYMWDLTTANYLVYAKGGLGFRYVPSLTGFFTGAFGATKAVSPQLTIPNTARVSNDVFSIRKSKSENKLIHFTVNNSGEKQDNVYILLSDNEVNAPKMFSLDNTAPQSYIFENEQASSIKSYSWSKEERIIPIAFESETSGTYSLNMKEFNISDKAYLRDLQTQAWFSLNESTRYEFTHNASNAKLRFELVLNPKTTGFESVETSIAQIYANKDVIYVNLAQAQNTTISVFDLSGRKVKELTSSAMSIQINDLQNGTYLVRVNSDKGNAVQKVFIND